jgi:hypothetical protein
MIEAGTICIWQNIVGSYSWMNGRECTATTGLQMHSVNNKPDKVLGYMTDTQLDIFGINCRCVAKPMELREKNPPKEEETIIQEKEFENV